jgi:hypothetical protein
MAVKVDSALFAKVAVQACKTRKEQKEDKYGYRSEHVETRNYLTHTYNQDVAQRSVFRSGRGGLRRCANGHSKDTGRRIHHPCSGSPRSEWQGNGTLPPLLQGSVAGAVNLTESELKDGAK